MTTTGDKMLEQVSQSKTKRSKVKAIFIRERLWKPKGKNCLILSLICNNWINMVPGLNNITERKHPSSVLSIFISRILATSSVRTRSKMVPTPAWWAELRWTVRPVAKTMPSLTSTERWEKAAISSSFQPASYCNKFTLNGTLEAKIFSSHSFEWKVHHTIKHNKII